MPNRQTLRAQAFHAQQGRCCYCGAPMWLTCPDELSPIGLRARSIKGLKCTAEHLKARQDGGRDVATNIAAACLVCNSRRHRRKQPPDPNAYKQFVRRRMGKGKWHPPVIHQAAVLLAARLTRSPLPLKRQQSPLPLTRLQSP